jgi:hypothetical protein
MQAMQESVEAELDRIDALTVSRSTAGSVNITTTGGNGIADVTFPVGRFTVPPIVLVTKQQGTNAGHVAYAENVTKDGFRLTLFGSGSGTTKVGWLAVQHSDTAAEG